MSLAQRNFESQCRSKPRHSHLKLVAKTSQLALFSQYAEEGISFSIPKRFTQGVQLPLDLESELPLFTIDLAATPKEASENPQSANSCVKVDLIFDISFLPGAVRNAINRILGINLNDTADAFSVPKEAAEAKMEALASELEGYGVKVELKNNRLLFSYAPSNDPWAETGH